MSAGTTRGRRGPRRHLVAGGRRGSPPEAPRSGAGPLANKLVAPPAYFSYGPSQPGSTTEGTMEVDQ